MLTDYVPPPDGQLEQIKGIDVAVNRMQVGRDEKKKKEELASRSSGKKQARLLGAPVMDTSVTKNKFKSPFGEAPPIKKPLSARKSKKDRQSLGNYRKPVSFFDSQKLDKSQIPTESQVQEYMVDMNNAEQEQLRGGEQQIDDNLTDELNEPENAQHSEEPRTEQINLDSTDGINLGAYGNEGKPNQEGNMPTSFTESDQNPAQNEDAANDEPSGQALGADTDQPADDREPKLFVDVNVANFGLKRIIVYEGDTV